MHASKLDVGQYSAGFEAKGASQPSDLLTAREEVTIESKESISRADDYLR